MNNPSAGTLFLPIQISLLRSLGTSPLLRQKKPPRGMYRRSRAPEKELLPMKISSKLSLFYVAVLAVFVVMAAALAADLQSVTVGYEALLQTPIRQMDHARVVQVDFKKQVQEWKDMLLRGHNPDDLAKYTSQFKQKEQLVRAGAQFLPDQAKDPQAKQLID